MKIITKVIDRHNKNFERNLSFMTVEQNFSDKENSKQIVWKLVQKYKKIIDEKKVGSYNEEETKKGFIQPLFKSLGWNIEDRSEVTAEEKISKKRVDYGFKVNGIPKFYLDLEKMYTILVRVGTEIHFTIFQSFLERC